MTRRIAPVLAVTILAAALSACGGGADAANDSAALEAAGNEEASADLAAADETAPVTPAAAEIGGAPTADYMIGKWSAMDEDCADVLEFRKDGTMMTPVGEAKWTLVGDKMTMDYGDGSKQPASSIKVLSQERIEVTRGSGGKETAKRC